MISSFLVIVVEFGKMKVYSKILCGSFFACACDVAVAMSYDHELLGQPDSAVAESKAQALEAVSRIQETNLKKSSVQRLGLDLTIIVDCLTQVQDISDGNESVAHLVSSIRSAAEWSPNTQKGKLNQIKNMTRQAEKLLNRWPDD